MTAKPGKLDQRICWWSLVIFYQMFGFMFGYLTQIMRPPIPGATLPLNGIFTFTLGNASHMQMGMALLAIFPWRELRGTASPRVNFLQIGATYWHMVDFLWIVIFALIYLMR